MKEITLKVSTVKTKSGEKWFRNNFETKSPMFESLECGDYLFLNNENEAIKIFHSSAMEKNLISIESIHEKQVNNDITIKLEWDNFDPDRTIWIRKDLNEFSEIWVDNYIDVEFNVYYGEDIMNSNDKIKYVKLNNGKYLINDYGKYCSGLSFIKENNPFVIWAKKNYKDFNFPNGNLDAIYGDFFISKKGTKCFEIKPEYKAKHILICDSWGGAFNSYRGKVLPEKEALYFKRAKSNGGGVGCDYAIFQKHWELSVSEDEI